MMPRQAWELTQATRFALLAPTAVARTQPLFFALTVPRPSLVEQVKGLASVADPVQVNKLMFFGVNVLLVVKQLGL
jgi:hypothetical protein